LRPVGRRVVDHPLGDQCHAMGVGKAQSQRLPGQAATDYDYIKGLQESCSGHDETEYSMG
jgi:hypothetical protein